MRVARSPFGFAGTLAGSLLFSGCGGGDAPEAFEPAGGASASGGIAGGAGAPAGQAGTGTSAGVGGGTGLGGRAGLGGAAGGGAAGSGSGGRPGAAGEPGASGGAGASSGGREPGLGGRGGVAGDSANGGRGGRATGGSAGAPGGMGGTSGSGGITPGDCTPVTPGATPEAQKLLCYLYEQYGNHVLSGQQETSWASDPEKDMKYINDQTGKYPAIRGLDFIYTQQAERAQAWWNAGGIPMICYHMGAPTLSDDYEGSQQAVPGGIDAVLTEGSSQYNSFVQRLDKAAAELTKLKNANVPVIWRPFHEAGGDWFWWSMEGGEQYVRLWQFMFEYFTTEKGLTNLLWLHPYNGEPDGSFYPGKDFVDIGGADTYATNGPFTALYARTHTIVGTSLPIALHENGLLPDPAAMFAGNAAPWVMFNTWADTYLTQTNSASHLKAVYADEHVITRDELPSFK